MPTFKPDFARIKQDKQTLADFFKFCIVEENAENVLFLLAVDKYRLAPTMNKLDVIWELFLAEHLVARRQYTNTASGFMVNTSRQTALAIQDLIKASKYQRYHQEVRRVRAYGVRHQATTPTITAPNIFDLAARDVVATISDSADRYSDNKGSTAYGRLNKNEKDAAAKGLKPALDALAKVGIHLRDDLGWN